MSASAIWNVLQKKNPQTFSKISQSTIEGWIDRSNPDKPNWSHAALKMAELGNHQGHPNGGCRGALVCNSD
jgi:hypothetical protein